MIIHLKSFLEIVDASLVEKSFKRMEVPKPPATKQPPSARSAALQTEAEQAIPLKTSDGTHLADLFVNQDAMRVLPRPDVMFDASSPPFKTFLIGRVLEPIQARDRESSRAGQLPPDKILSYRVEKDGNILKELVVTNYGDERRLLELKNAIRWTFRRIHERSLAGP